MGQKIHPHGLRLGIIKTWDSRWYGEKDYQDNLHEDLFIRDTILKWNFRGESKPSTGKALKKSERENRRFSSISKVEIERKAKNVTIYIVTAKPGIVIGKSGESIESLTKFLREKTKKAIDIKIRPIDQPDLDAFLVAESVATMLERRYSARRAMKQAVDRVLRAGAVGVKVWCAGRLGGAEIARREWIRRGRVPLHTLRANIDYSLTEAHTTHGKIGVKVWIYLGDVDTNRRSQLQAADR